MQLTDILAIFLLFQTFSVNALVIIDSTIASSCKYYLDQFNWDCYIQSSTKHGGSYPCYCTNTNWLQSVTNCIYNATTEQHLRIKGFEHISKRCKQKVGIDISLNEMENYRLNGMNFLVNVTDIAIPVNGTLIVNKDNFNWYHLKFKQVTLFVRDSQWFGWGLVFYWIFILSVATILNLNDKLIGWKPLDKFYSNSIKKYLIIPPLWNNKYHERTFILWKFIPLNFPLRLNGIIVTVFVILTIIFCCINYDTVTLPHPYLTTSYYANVVLISYRTDMISIALFPLIYLFGSRNNFLLPLTGLSFSSFQFYHKWCAYVAVTLAFIHTIVWSAWAFNKGGPYSAWYIDAYWKWGIAAITLMILLVLHSEKIIRDIMYEIFLWLHQFMAIIFIVAMYYHLVPMGWQGWIYSIIAIYSLERFMRLFKIILNGGLISATLQSCGDDVVKIIIPKPKYCSYPAGSFAYIYFLSLYDAWFYNFQSHPFTILKEPQTRGENLIIYFKVQKGITRVMFNNILGNNNNNRGKLNCKILLEGPYGTTFEQRVKLNKNVTGITAGLGICAVFPHLYQTINLNNTDMEKPRFNYKLYWVIHNYNDVAWFRTELESFRQRGGEIVIIVTGDNTNDNSSFDSSNSGELLLRETEKINNLNDFTIKHLGERPDLEKLVEDEINQSEKQENDLVIITCGPSEFNDELRSIVGNKLNKDTKIDISYKSESFTW